jgi:DNA-directed RNA polymerase specialized sigma24 family protein
MPTDKPTELELLCRWLNSGINRKNNKSDQMFAAYYNAIEKKLLPYLIPRLEDVDLAEQFFQEIMFKISILCIERQQIAKRIEELTREQDALNLNNPCLKKRTHTWTTDVRNWTKEAISFSSDHSQTKSPELDNQVKNFNCKIEPLKKEGVDVLNCLADNIVSIQEEKFVEITSNIIGNKKPRKPNLLSKIRIPTRALLFKMAINKIKDYWKKKSEIRLEPNWNNEDEEDENPQNSIIEEAALERWVHQKNQGIASETDNIPEAIEFLLQAPIRNAETQLREATGKQEILRSQNRLDKARVSYSKHLEILAMIENDYTQEQMAIELDMTRDQVRYLQPQIKDLLKLLKGDLS